MLLSLMEYVVSAVLAAAASDSGWESRSNHYVNSSCPAMGYGNPAYISLWTGSEEVLMGHATRAKQ